MVVEYADFVAEFEEFRNAPSGKVTAKLAEAEARTPEEIWGDLQAAGIKYLAAHLLALAPAAKDMRKGMAPGQTMYSPERERLEIIVSSGYRIAGEP